MSRLIVVSQRLPPSFRRTAFGLEPEAAGGGLATTLSDYVRERTESDAAFECVWAGRHGADATAHRPEASGERSRGDIRRLPIPVSGEAASQFDDGFCSRTLWPLFHYFPSDAAYAETDFESYRRLNEIYCDAVLGAAADEDEILVHDYELLLLPRMLRKKLPRTAIGFFLHTPFPSFEAFRQLPARWRREMLHGMLGADLIGFQAPDYAQHFLHSALRTLGYESHVEQPPVGGEGRWVESFPTGIDFELFRDAAGSDAVSIARRSLEGGLRGRKAILAVDRVDHSKGLVQRVRGFEALLAMRPEWRHKVVLLLVVVPSLERVGQHQRMKQELDELVGQINGSYGSVDWVPIIYQCRAVSFTELVALYGHAPIALFTPLPDGMTLLAKEYLASRPDGTGVLVLSEMTAASHGLSEALHVNPNHPLEIADALVEALQMSVEEQFRRNRPMRERLRFYDVQHWIANFIDTLRRTRIGQGKLCARNLVGTALDEIVAPPEGAEQRRRLLDANETLVPLAAQSDSSRPDDALLELLRALTESRG